MSISSSITGGPVNNDAAQVFSLLSVIANPESYNEKLSALVAATEENKKIIDLVGSASEILKIREEIEEDKAEAKAIVADAKKKAADIIAKAEKAASATQKTAEEKANNLMAESSKVKSEADSYLLEVKELKVALELDHKALVSAKSEAESEKQRHSALLGDLEKEQASYFQMKKVLQDKVSAFAADIA